MPVQAGVIAGEAVKQANRTDGRINELSQAADRIESAVQQVLADAPAREGQSVAFIGFPIGAMPACRASVTSAPICV